MIGAVALSVFLASLPRVLAYESAAELCPQLCSISGSKPGNWTYYHHQGALAYCNQTTLFDLPLYTSISDPDTHVTLRACTTSGGAGSDSSPLLRRALRARQFASNTTTGLSPGSTSTPSSSNSGGPLACGAPGAPLEEQKVNIFVSSTAGGADTAQGNSSLAGYFPQTNLSSSGILAAAQELQSYVERLSNCHSTILFAQADQTVVGIYAGYQIQKKSAASLIGQFMDYAKTKSTGFDTLAAEVCDPKSNTTRSDTFGIFAHSNGNISAVQEALKNWSEAQCLGASSNQETLSGSITILSALLPQEAQITSGNSPSNGTSPYNNTLASRDVSAADSTCKYYEVVDKDNCWAIWHDKCKVSEKDFYNWNGGSDAFCSGLKAGDYVCCSAGNPPDFTPKPNPDGSCATYTTFQFKHPDDPKTIENLNKNTWGFSDCPGMGTGMNICVSTGDPPMPAPIPNAICGPQVSGSKRPGKGQSLADLNPCPINACCDIFGQCGITSEFCTDTRPPGGAPGTAKKDTPGCISNCGNNITNIKRPAHFQRIGYFEAWNKDRPCLHMDISKMNYTQYYTTVHFAFGNITRDFQVDISSQQDQFDGFVKLTNINRVLSFGGWSFSTDSDTAPIFRQGVTDAQRDAFANSVVAFVQKYNLDGVDFDWEYPGADDIKGAGKGSPQDGPNYVQFLKMVKDRIGKGKTVSIAAPASYWYLRNFPIKDIAGIVDYIVYMTYDLHGQWDYDNVWSNAGCPGKGGNCLRSHVNMTETMDALAMITKAGVSTDKILVGMAKYGRSFQMEDYDCRGVSCHFTGPESGAQPGQCTNTGGYISNFELRRIMTADPETNPDYAVEKYFDQGDVMIYGGNNWVSYLSDEEYDRRMKKWAAIGFAGTSDWAADLDRDWGDDGKGGISDNGDIDEADEGPLCDYSKTYGSLEDLQKDAGGMPALCAQVFALQVLTANTGATWDKYNDLNNGYDDKFDAYVRYTKLVIPANIDAFMIARDGSPGPGFAYFDCVMDEVGNDEKTKPCLQLTDYELHYGNYHMTFKIHDLDGFNAAFLNATGIDPTWIEFAGTKEFHTPCGGDGTPGGCDPQYGDRYWNGYPSAKADLQVPNPKDTITKGIGNVGDLINGLAAGALNVGMSQFDGSPDDIIQTLSVPVFMMAQAVEAMENVKVLGQKQEDEDAQAKKDFILEIVGAVLCFVPFVGEEAALLAGMANLAKVISIAGEVANAGFAIFDTVNDPSSAFMNLVGTIMGIRGLAKEARDGQGFAKMGKDAKTLRAGDLSKLGKSFKEKDDLLQGIVNVCKK